MSKGKDLINSIKYGLYRMLTEKKALAFLYKLERHTLELVELSKRISALVEEFQSKYPVR
ncbi:plasmid mobilization protein [Bacteroides uniformis]|nr:hypothetical protein GAS25_19415 [Bacteroides uniformis]